mgnify:CR=1 FL=1
MSIFTIITKNKSPVNKVIETDYIEIVPEVEITMEQKTVIAESKDLDNEFETDENNFKNNYTFEQVRKELLDRYYFKNTILKDLLNVYYSRYFRKIVIKQLDNTLFYKNLTRKLRMTSNSQNIDAHKKITKLLLNELKNNYRFNTIKQNNHEYEFNSSVILTEKKSFGYDPIKNYYLQTHNLNFYSLYDEKKKKNVLKQFRQSSWVLKDIIERNDIEIMQLLISENIVKINSFYDGLTFINYCIKIGRAHV